MSRLLLIGGLVLVVAALVMFCIAIWSGDDRWLQMAFVFLFPGIFGVIVGGSNELLRGVP